GAARGPAVSVQAGREPDAGGGGAAARRARRGAARRGHALGRSSGGRAQEGEEGGPAGARTHGATVPGVRGSGAAGGLLRQVAPVLPDVPDRRQAPRRPAFLEVPQVAKVVLSRGRGSVGRAQPCQGWGRGFESRRPLSLETQVR